MVQNNAKIGGTNVASLILDVNGTHFFNVAIIFQKQTICFSYYKSAAPTWVGLSKNWNNNNLFQSHSRRQIASIWI